MVTIQPLRSIYCSSRCFLLMNPSVFSAHISKSTMLVSGVTLNVTHKGVQNWATKLDHISLAVTLKWLYVNRATCVL